MITFNTRASDSSRHDVPRPRPAGDPKDPISAGKTEEFNRIEVGRQNAQLDESCLAAHPTAPYLCADDSYLELNHITTPFFQIQDLQDGLLLNGLKESGVISTPAATGQLLYDQLSALTNIRNTAVERASITATPGVVGRLCGFHVTMHGLPRAAGFESRPR